MNSSIVVYWDVEFLLYLLLLIGLIVVDWAYSCLLGL